MNLFLKIRYSTLVRDPLRSKNIKFEGCWKENHDANPITSRQSITSRRRIDETRGGLSRCCRRRRRQSEAPFRCVKRLTSFGGHLKFSSSFQFNNNERKTSNFWCVGTARNFRRVRFRFTSEIRNRCSAAHRAKTCGNRVTRMPFRKLLASCIEVEFFHLEKQLPRGCGAAWVRQEKKTSQFHSIPFRSNFRRLPNPDPRSKSD